MQSKRKITYRLYPSPRQQEELLKTLRLHQKLYNGALEHRILAYKAQKKSIRFFDQSKELTQLRKECDEYKALNAQSCQVTLKRLDLAFQNFFRRVKNNEAKAGFPRFKAFDRYSGWGYKTHGDGWKLLCGEKNKHGFLRLSGIGKLKIRGQAKDIGTPKTCEIQHKQGRFYASITCEVTVSRQSGKEAFGIDWGLKEFAVLADTNDDTFSIANPRFLKKSLAKLKQKQVALSRKKRGSKNRQKARSDVAKVHAKVSNQRKDFLHKTTAHLVQKSALLAVEKLNVKGMSSAGGARKKGLNREILAAAPGMFHQMLKYKAEEAGLEYCEIDPRQAKPSQTCHRCGSRKKKLLSERTHSCEQCGISCDRDENAAKVILFWALHHRAPGWEPTSCREEALAFSLKQETPSKVASG